MRGGVKIRHFETPDVTSPLNIPGEQGRPAMAGPDNPSGSGFARFFAANSSGTPVLRPPVLTFLSLLFRPMVLLGHPMAVQNWFFLVS
jgi:hypothetical protein